MGLLTDDQIQSERAAVPEWSVDAKTITRTVKCKTFPDAIKAVAKIGDAAEEMDHHPDIDIRWRTLHFALTTHSEGGLTGNDFQLAAKIDAILTDFT